jgi:DNA-binding SARP family transcriptional activator/tetratricopeptide (TPR) repeat protein
MDDVRIGLLGGFTVSVGGRSLPPASWSRRSSSAVVKLLALAPGRSLHRDQVVDALWPDLAPDAAADRLNTAVHYARRALGSPQALARRGEVLALDGGVEVDVDTFAVLARTAVRTRTAADVDAALAAYPGPLLPDDLFAPWAEADRDRLAAVHTDLLRAGRRWDELLALEPADEQAHMELLRAHAARGDRRAVLRQFERLDRALRVELGVAPSAEAVALRDSVAPPTTGHAPRVPALVGRRPELEKLEVALRQSRAGRGGTVLVHGPAGIGTSAVLAWVRARAEDGGARVGAGAAAALEEGWPYAPVLEALADLARRHPALLDGLGDTYREEIGRALRGDHLEWSGEGTHQRLFVSAAELVRLAAAGSGVVLTVDDLAEADEASLRMLHYLARAVAAAPVLLVLGARTPEPGSRLDQLRTGLLRRQALVELPLTPLSPAGTTALLAQRLGSPPGDAVAADVHRLSRGLPRRIVELAPSAATSAPRWPDVRVLLDRCPPGTDEALRRVALAGTAFGTDEFLALAGVGEEAGFAVLEACLAEGLVEPAELGYRFPTEGLRDALLAGLPPHRRERLHREVAAALQEVGAAPARVGEHLLAAGGAAEAVPHLLRGAERAASLGAYRDALELVEQARPGATGQERGRLLGLRADLLRAVGDPAAVAAYRTAAAATDGHARRQLLARLAQTAGLEGDTDTAEEALVGLAPDGGPADASILLAQGVVAYFHGDLETAHAATESVRRTPRTASDWRLSDLVTLQGLIAHDRGEWFPRLHQEMLQTREEPAIATAVFDAHLCVAEFMLYGTVPYADVLALSRSFGDAASQSGAQRAVAFARALTGEAALLSGDLTTAEAELRAAADLHARIGASAGEAHSLQRLAEVRLQQGDRAEARRLLTRALPRARWSPIAMHLMQRIHGTTIAAADTPADAYAAAEAAEASIAREDRCLFCQIMIAVPSAIACADVGDLEGAGRHLRAAEHSPALAHSTAWQAAVLEVRAHLAGAEGDEATRSTLFEEAARRFEDAGQPLDATRCLSAAGVSAGSV